MTALVPLHFAQADVRMIVKDGAPWWVLADVAKLLDLANPSKLASRIEEYQKATIPIRDISSGQNRSMIVINEPGIYALTLNSRKPEARAFAHWLFTDVLPSIRKHGFYDPARLAAMEAAALPAPSSPVPATQHERLLEEVARWENDSGYKIHAIPGMSKNRLAIIEIGGGSIPKMLTRGGLWLRLTASGFDLFYVLFGRRSRVQEQTTSTSHSIPLISSASPKQHIV